jgi:polyisoprenoid-binding protein YceI
MRMRISTSAVVSILFAWALQGAAAGDVKIFEAIKGESTLNYRLVHPMHVVHGVSKDFQCKVTTNGDTSRVHVAVSANVSSFNSGNSNRDSHALEVLDALRYPNVSFVSDKAVPIENRSRYQVTGQLTFHGITREISFPVIPKRVDHKINVKGGFDINLSDYKVARPSLLGVAVKDKLTITFDLWAPEE